MDVAPALHQSGSGSGRAFPGGLVPRFLERRLALNPAASSSLWSERFTGVVLFADVSGFTALAERLAERGPDGLEELSRLLNACFGRIVDLVAACDGDIIRFAGDAPIVLFRDEAADAEQGPDRLAFVVERAARCGVALQHAIADWRATDNVPLSMRVSIGAGDLLAASVGGLEDRRELFVGGDPLRQIAATLHVANPGEVILSPRAHQLSAGRVPGRWCGHEGFRVEGLDAFWVTAASTASPILPATVRAFVSRAVLTRTDAGQDAWLAELRRITVSFLSLADIDCDSPDAARRLQEAFQQIQAAVYGAEGSINQFVADDKGTIVVAAWGLPTRTHEDDAVRAVRATLDAQARLSAMGVASSAGIATGRVFCGWRGNDQRREYAMIGTVVNLAARLMTATDRVLCDAATQQAARARVDFGSPTAVAIKGATRAVETFQPLSRDRADTETLPPPPGAPASAHIVGRATERAVLAEALVAVRRGKGGVIVVQGEAGIGKSSLLNEAILRARRDDVLALSGAGDSLSREAYHPWRTVLETLVDLPARSAVQERRDRLAAFLADQPELVERAPLLGAVLGLDLQDNDITAQMTERLRADNTRKIVVDLLQRASDRHPALFVLDDAHWFDSLSWALLRDAVRRAHRAVWVIGLRPMGDDAPLELRELVDAASTRALVLGALDETDVDSLVARQLGVHTVPAAVSALVREKAGGHPLFVAELTSGLRDAGLIVVRDGVSVLIPDTDALRAHRFPDTVQGVIVSRLDRLSPQEQLTLKVASVIGPVFSIRTLTDIHPVDADRPDLARQLAEFARLGLATAEADATYAFRHLVMQEVAYDLMAGAQRVQLHRDVAMWYERQPADRPPALLAHHWMRAEEPGRGVTYLERAGEVAAGHGADRETIRFFTQAIDVADSGRVGVLEPLRRAAWMRQVGHAYAMLGQVERCLTTLRSALDLTGRQLPRSTGGMSAQLVKEVARKLFNAGRIGRRWASSTARGRLVEQARITGILGEQSYYQNDPLTYLTASLASINLAEASGAIDIAGRAYASAGYIAALLKLESLARSFWTRAEASGEVYARINALSAQGMHALGQARWQECEAAVDTLFDLGERVGAHAAAEGSFVIRGMMLIHRGRFAEARRNATETLAVSTAREHRQRNIWCHLGLAAIDIETHAMDSALEHLARARELFDGSEDAATTMSWRTYEFAVRLRNGEIEWAGREAGRVLDLLRATPAFFRNVTGCVALFDWYRSQWERARTTAPREARGWRGLACQAAKLLRQLAWFQPVARPHAFLVNGEIAWLDGAPGRANNAWTRSLALARQLGMPQDEANAHEQLGTHAAARSADRARHLERALAIFSELGCAGHQERVEAKLVESR